MEESERLMAKEAKQKSKRRRPAAAGGAGCGGGRGDDDDDNDDDVGESRGAVGICLTLPVQQRQPIGRQ